MSETRVSGIGLVALLAGGACIALSPIFVRLVLPEVSAQASAFWRVALAIAPLWLWLVLAEPKRPARPAPTTPPYKALAWAAFFFAGDLGFWHASLVYTSVANSTLEANFAPVFVTLAAWMLFGQRVTRAFVVALIVTLVGAVLLVGPNFSAGGDALLGDALGVITAVFYAGYMLAVRAASASASVPRIALTTSVGSALLLLPYALISAEKFMPTTLSAWATLAGLAFVSHALGQSLIAFGLGRVPTTLSSVTLLIQPLLAAVFAWLLLAEPMAPLQMFGGAIVLVGIALARRAS
jgi:drug/metabolite transporter (DMT)-like permease